MNDLEQWLADVKVTNDAAQKMKTQIDGFMVVRNKIEEQGRALGLKRSKIKSMLASVRLKVEMPGEPETEK